MDPKIHQLYTEDILAEVSIRFEINIDALEELDGFESYIYSFEKDGKGYILRIGHSSHRDADAVQGEAEFIDYLGANGINVGRPVRDANGNLVEAIPAAEGEFVAVVFEKVPGDHAPWEMWQDGELMNKLGRMLGKMHRLSKDFQPSEERFRRLDWEEDIEASLIMIDKGVSSAERLFVRNRFKTLINQVRALPKDRENYGLIHNDVHGGNFFLHGNEIHLFDFDDCYYSWYANDIAMVLFYAGNGFNKNPEDRVILERQARAFFSGYEEENEINPAWLEHIQAFLTLRDIDLYARIQHDFLEEEYDDWCRRFVAASHDRIFSSTPFLPIDFTTVLD